MEWTWLLTTISILFFLLFYTRLVYMRGYREGAKKGFDKGAQDVLEQWKEISGMVDNYKQNGEDGE